jgi:hypothetical protein
VHARQELTLAGALLLAATAGCGARTSLLPEGSGGASAGGPEASSSSSGSGAFPPHPMCTSAEGVRLCGDGCPPLDTNACPGFGCTPALDLATEQPSSAGLCWSDLPDQGVSPCNHCPDGSGCLERTPGLLICVPIGVCEALWDLGATTVCRYVDKSTYNHEPLPMPEGPCPVGVDQYAFEVGCGGECGPCDSQYVCSGRSPRHPFGSCEPAVAAGGCGLRPDGSYAAGCVWSSHYVCGVYVDASEDEPSARLYGSCDEIEDCDALAASLPGGYACFGKNGKPVH